MNIFRILFSISVILPGLAFGETSLEVANDALLSFTSSGEKLEVKANTKKKLVLDQPIWVEQKHRVPVLMVPVFSKTSNLKVDSPKVTQVVEVEYQKMADKKLSHLLDGFTQVQKHIASKRMNDANEALQELQRDFPHVKYLKFLEASIHVIQGNKSRAIASVREGLEAHPDNRDAKKLLKTLEGGQ